MSAAKKKTTAENTNQQQDFSADVARLLEIVAGALYTNHDVFLRELISNAADACAKLRFEAIQKPDLTKGDPNFRIHVFKNTDERTVSVFDNGIGMSAEELADHLGTIAKSGSRALMEQMKEAKQQGGDALKLIGQFGVGFYAAYMVASHVKVISRKAGTKDTNTWESDGRTGFTVREATKDEAALLCGERGTLIILSIKDEGAEFLIEDKLRHVITEYSDHIDTPIYLLEPQFKEGQLAVNQASALWMRSKSEVTEEEYTAFYKHITFGFDEPLMTSHWRAEGLISFNALLFIPTMRPWDLYDPTRKNAVRLYVRRVFISDKIESLMYPWLRFVRGAIDSEDLPLNISRESLQYNPVIGKIRSSVAKRVLGDLNKLSQNDEASFLTFWGQFGSALKEGLYDAAEHRDDIFKICRFATTFEDGKALTSLDDYIARMKDDQKEIYYISGESIEALRRSPQLEGFKKRGIEVLLFTDTIDDFWLQQVPEFKGKAFKSITKGAVDLKDDKPKDKEKTEENSEFLSKLKEILKEEVEDVKFSSRLTDSPSCLIAPEHGVDMHMERVLKLHQKYDAQTRPVLEINPDHALVKKAQEPEAKLDDIACLLLDLATVSQGLPLKDPSRLSRIVSGLV
ncbi:MAG: molecular chaperone HtpG [Alphaproteobacteria bacterium]|nr:molecular chaperone HtpG [Alphaproteobacteria bacterium]